MTLLGKVKTQQREDRLPEYRLKLQSGKTMVVGWTNRGAHYGTLELGLYDKYIPQSESGDGPSPSFGIGADSVDFKVILSRDARYAVLSRVKSHGIEPGWTYTGEDHRTENDSVLVSLLEPSVRELRQVPDDVIGGTFDRKAERVALVGDNQAWLFNVADGTLIWRTPLSEISSPVEYLSTFELAVPLAMTDNLLLTQYGNDTLAALSLRHGEITWISARLGISGNGKSGRLRFNLSPDGSVLAVFNTARLRLIQTKTGTFLTPAVSVQSLARDLGRHLQLPPEEQPHPREGGIRDVEFSAEGWLLVDVESTRFFRYAPLPRARVEVLLPNVDAYTAISTSDGKTLIGDLRKLSRSGMNK